MPQPQTFWPSDGGPIYAETPAQLADGQWLIEPWNAISSLLIILPGLYFLYRLRGQYKQHLLLSLCAPILIIGGLGSTLFHGLRNDSLFLVMDVFPTMAVFVTLIVFLWQKVLNSWIWAGLVLLLFVGISVLTYRTLPLGLRINVGYLIRGTAFFIPMLILLIRTRFSHFGFLLLGLLGFVAALYFRSIDKDSTDLLPMGTHFLWHTATGVGGILVAEYLLRIRGMTHHAPAG